MCVRFRVGRKKNDPTVQGGNKLRELQRIRATWTAGCWTGADRTALRLSTCPALEYASKVTHHQEALTNKQRLMLSNEQGGDGSPYQTHAALGRWLIKAQCSSGQDSGQFCSSKGLKVNLRFPPCQATSLLCALKPPIFVVNKPWCLVKHRWRLKAFQRNRYMRHRTAGSGAPWGLSKLPSKTELKSGCTIQQVIKGQMLDLGQEEPIC